MCLVCQRDFTLPTTARIRCAQFPQGAHDAAWNSERSSPDVRTFFFLWRWCLRCCLGKQMLLMGMEVQTVFGSPLYGTLCCVCSQASQSLPDVVLPSRSSLTSLPPCCSSSQFKPGLRVGSSRRHGPSFRSSHATTDSPELSFDTVGSTLSGWWFCSSLIRTSSQILAVMPHLGEWSCE